MSTKRSVRPEGHWSEQAIEIFEAVLLAVVAVATAWSGYQAARWDGREAHFYAISSRDRLVATQASTLGGQQRLYDTSTFSFWLQAESTGNTTAQRLFEKRFRLEYRPAFAAWLKTDPFHNPNAPAGPIVMPQYHNAQEARSAAYEKKAEVAFESGTVARERGDEYVRNTVLLATVLFLTAIASRFKIRRVRLALLGLSSVLLVLALSFVLSYPVA